MEKIKIKYKERISGLFIIIFFILSVLGTIKGINEYILPAIGCILIVLLEIRAKVIVGLFAGVFAVYICNIFLNQNNYYIISTYLMVYLISVNIYEYIYEKNEY